ncbi:MAG: GNAT family N-acetyltransferase [Oscillospiraceae bacterium]|nr:GNAT family N-acetyltransferase [Oscillospiraceae bacterium]
MNYIDEIKALLARDYNCSFEDFGKGGHILTMPPESGGRNYCEYSRFFRMVTFGNNCVICADKVLQPYLREFIKSESGHRLFEQNLLSLFQEEPARFGYKLGGSYHYYLPEKKTNLSGDFHLKWMFDKLDFEQFYGDERFPNALCEHYSEIHPDIIVVLAYDGENIMGMAGCSEDAPHWLQIGVDVIPEYRGRGVGTFLVNSLENEIIRRGEIPFYDTATANIHSQKIALKCGFKPAFTEIGAIGKERNIMDDKEKQVPETSDEKTWVDDMKQELENYIEEQGIYIRQ